MVYEIITQIAAYGHILSGMGWLGGGMMTALALGPNLRKMSPASALEFNAKVLPKLARFVQTAVGLTLLFGLVLLYQVASAAGGSSYFSTLQGEEISAGMGLALVTAALAFSVVLPSFKKVSKLSAAAIASQQPPPPEMMAYAKRAGRGAEVGLVLLLITLAAMVAAGF